MNKQFKITMPYKIWNINKRNWRLPSRWTKEHWTALWKDIVAGEIKHCEICQEPLSMFKPVLMLCHYHWHYLSDEEKAKIALDNSLKKP